MSSQNNLLKEIKEFSIYIIVALIMALTIRSYVFAKVTVSGPSMQSTLHNNDVLFIEKISTETSHINRGDIVVFDSKNQYNDNYIKRVIGIAGDTVEIKNGKVYLNDKELEENYLDPNTITEPLTTQSRFVVPTGSVFVLGDNRSNSLDSRALGCISIKDLKGRSIVRVFPFNKITLFK